MLPSRETAFRVTEQCRSVDEYYHLLEKAFAAGYGAFSKR